jgi:hypothetical protein
VTDTALRYECPRCRIQVEERFYGPCESCRGQLVASLGQRVEGGAEDLAVSRFEPGLHVVPNHVATKE